MRGVIEQRRLDGLDPRNPVRSLSQRVTSWLLVGLVAIGGVVSVLATTRHGPGLTPDSAVYIGAADNLRNGRGLTVPFSDYPLPPGSESVTTGPKQAHPLVNFPPLFSASLAAGSWATGASTITVARWLNVLAFGVTIFLVGLLVSSLSGSTLAATLAAVLAAGAADLFTVHASALAEPLFLPLVLAALWLLARYVRRPALPRLMAFAAICGLATLVRFSGGALVATGVVVVVAQRGSWRCRIGHAAFAVLVALLPIAVWLATRTRAGGPRPLAFHPLSIGNVNEAVVTVAGWLLPAGAAHVIDALIVLAVAVGIGIVYDSTRRRVPSLVGILLAFSVIYVLFMVVSITFFDANVSPLSPRILLPAHVVVLVAVPCLIVAAWPKIRSPTRMYPLTVAVAGLVVLACFSLVRGVAWMTKTHDDSLGYASLVWRRSPIIARVRVEPANRLIYSNAPDALYLLAHRVVASLPQREDMVSRTTNRSLQADLRSVGQALRTEDGIIVYVKLPFRQFVPSPREIDRVVGVQTVISVRDGSLLTVRQ